MLCSLCMFPAIYCQYCIPKLHHQICVIWVGSGCDVLGICGVRTARTNILHLVVKMTLQFGVYD